MRRWRNAENARTERWKRENEAQRLKAVVPVLASLRFDLDELFGLVDLKAHAARVFSNTASGRPPKPMKFSLMASTQSTFGFSSRKCR